MSCVESAIQDLVGVALGILFLSLTVFEIFSIFICMENPITTPNFGVKYPKIITGKFFNPQKGVTYAEPHLLSHFGLSLLCAFGLVCGRVKEKVTPKEELEQDLLMKASAEVETSR